MTNVGKKVTNYVTEENGSLIHPCRYYKDWDAWKSGSGICYIPGCEVSEYGHDGIITEEEINTWGVGYTKEDFMQEIGDVLEEEYDFPFSELTSSMSEKIGEMIFGLLNGGTPENGVRINIGGVFSLYNGDY